MRDREEDVAVRTRLLEKKRTITNTQKGEQSDREQRVKRDKQDHRDSFKKERRPCLDGFFFFNFPTPSLSPSLSFKPLWTWANRLGFWFNYWYWFVPRCPFSFSFGLPHMWDSQRITWSARFYVESSPIKLKLLFTLDFDFGHIR